MSPVGVHPATVLVAICYVTLLPVMGAAGRPYHTRRRPAIVVASCTNATDCRPEFQAALDRAPIGVIIPARETPYPIREPGLWPRSNTVLTLESGASLLAARGAFVHSPPGMFSGDGTSMVVIKDVTNVSILGHNATIRMRKDDYNSLPAYAPHPSSGRMGIIMRNCSDIRVAGLTVSHTGGDGIYIGRNHEAAPWCCTDAPPGKCSNETTACHGVASNVHISDVRSLYNSRQGMSIVAGINITVERSEFSWTQGACPQAGIDIEPSSGEEPVSNITLREIVCRNNTGSQLQLPLDPYVLAPGGLPVRLVLDGVHLYGANWSSRNDGCSSSGLGLVMGPFRSIGEVLFSNILVEETPAVGLLIEPKAQSTIDTKGHLGVPGATVVAAKLEMRNITLRHTALRPVTNGAHVESPMVIGTDSVHNYTVGNISMVDMKVVSSAASMWAGQPWLTAGVGPYCADGTGWQLNNSSITGSATIWAPHRAECSVSTPPEVKLGAVAVHCVSP